MNRLDLAKQELKELQSQDDDNPLSILATIWCSMRSGKEDDGSMLIQGICDSFNNTPMLQNLKAVEQMQMGNFEDALQEIVDCHELLGEAILVDSDQKRIALTNEITCRLHLGQIKEAQDAFEKLSTEFPQCAFLQSYNELGSLFDRCSSNYN